LFNLLFSNFLIVVDLFFLFFKEFSLSLQVLNFDFFVLILDLEHLNLCNVGFILFDFGLKLGHALMGSINRLSFSQNLVEFLGLGLKVVAHALFVPGEPIGVVFVILLSLFNFHGL